MCIQAEGRGGDTDCCAHDATHCIHQAFAAAASPPPPHLARADAELVPDGREAEHDVQELADLVDEEGPQVLHRVQNA